MIRDGRPAGPLPAALAAACLGVATPAHAAPEEIQIYVDDLTAPGGLGVDVHTNYAIDASRRPDYAGGRAPAHLFRLTPEFYFGLSPELELGLYVLGARAPGGRAGVDGAKLRLKYVPRHDTTAGGYWGVNLEVGRTALAASERPWNAELKVLAGWRRGPWLLALNVNADQTLSAHGGPTELDVDWRVSRALAGRGEFGVEVYHELGPLADLGRMAGRSQALYAVWDGEARGVELELGLGRGLTPASDRWVAKAIVGLRFR